MIVPDANLLIYAYDSTSAHHRAARAWWEMVLSSTTPVGIPWVVILAFTRLMTHPALSENPMTVQKAHQAVEAWMARDHVRLLSPTPDTFELLFTFLERAGTGGNLTTDAMIASMAVEFGGRVYTNDLDFNRFPEVVWVNPLLEPAS
jgi:toxin-antitoxin system PIN domain toxin